MADSSVVKSLVVSSDQFTSGSSKYRSSNPSLVWVKADAEHQVSGHWALNGERIIDRSYMPTSKNVTPAPGTDPERMEILSSVVAERTNHLNNNAKTLDVVFSDAKLAKLVKIARAAQEAFRSPELNRFSNRLEYENKRRFAGVVDGIMQVVTLPEQMLLSLEAGTFRRQAVVALGDGEIQAIEFAVAEAKQAEAEEVQALPAPEMVLEAPVGKKRNRR